MKLVEHPPKPTSQEMETFFHGKRDNDQYARKYKKTGEIELWWTGNGGYWRSYFDEVKFVCKPRIKGEK